jgi:hypothetical protein
MSYSVYQHWDPLKVCIVGRSYPPEFYSYIKNPNARSVMERIARETEEDYQKLVTLLESFGVKVLRPDIAERDIYLLPDDSSYIPPPMTPRDYSIMLGETFYFKTNHFSDWENLTWGNVLSEIKNHTKIVTDLPNGFNSFNSASTTRVGRDIYCGTDRPYQSIQDVLKYTNTVNDIHPEYRYHVVDTLGHSDASFCPVVPGLIVSLMDIQNYEKTFPGWEVIYLPDQSWSQVQPFLDLKRKNGGKWWVPGEELNNDFTDFVESWLGHWVGYVEETVFDVNMLVIDEKNVVCNNYNEKVFKAFERYGITPHVVNFRHRYFWDGGLHCITSDIHREGTMEDYFPERN